MSEKNLTKTVTLTPVKVPTPLYMKRTTVSIGIDLYDQLKIAKDLLDAKGLGEALRIIYNTWLASQ